MVNVGTSTRPVSVRRSRPVFSLAPLAGKTCSVHSAADLVLPAGCLMQSDWTQRPQWLNPCQITRDRSATAALEDQQVYGWMTFAVC